MATGDVIFFRAEPGSVVDRVIAWRTGGPFVHCEIDAGDGTSVGALARGVVRHPLPAGRGAVTAPTGKDCVPSRLGEALAWLLAHVGDEYGWDDIAAQALSIVFPRGPFLTRTRRMDCSDLAGRFLWAAGYPLPPRLLDAPELVSPNSLARALGVKVET